jgi:hypothetical protein
MKCSILLPFSPGSCLCSCASNQARRKPTLFKVTEPSSVPYRCHGRVFFLFFHVDVKRHQKKMKGVGGKGQGKPGKGSGAGVGSTYANKYSDSSHPT